MFSRSLLITFCLLFPLGAHAQMRWATDIQIQTEGLTQPERDRVQSAINAWQPYCPLALTLVSSCDRCVTIRRATIIDTRRLGESEIDYAQDTGIISTAIIRADPRAGADDKFEHVIEHELGHVLGLIEHRPKSVMSATWSGHHPGEAEAALLRLLYAPSIVRYSFRRIVSDGHHERRSKFVVNDQGNLVEIEARGKEFKNVPTFPISEHPTAPKGWDCAWTDELSGIEQIPDLFKVKPEKSGLFFPFEARKGKIVVRFSDYEIFRTEVAIKEWDGQP